MLISRAQLVAGIWDTFLKLREAESDLGRVCYYPDAAHLSEAIGSKHHGCPFPLSAYDNTDRSALKWQGSSRLWCYPADYMNGRLDVPLDGIDRFPIACMGTMFWFLYNAFKFAGIEQEISNTKLINFQSTTMQDAQEGIAHAAIYLGLATEHHQDPAKAKPGDLVAIRRNGSTHHWCIAFPKVTKYLNDGSTPNEHDTVTEIVSGTPCIGTIGASPEAIGSNGQVGYDYWAHEKDGTRDYIIVPIG